MPVPTPTSPRPEYTRSIGKSDAHGQLRWTRYVPTDLRRRLRPLLAPMIRRTPGRRVEWGNLLRDQPFSHHFGFDRGRPIDRRYIEDFLERHRDLIHGDVLEVRSPEYALRFGEGDLRAHVVDLDAHNRSATIIGDLCNPATLAPEGFDCVILTQTLHLIIDRDAALASAWQSVRPGGALIVTTPSVIRVDTETPETDCVRFTPVGLQAWLERVCPSAKIQVEGAGNLVTAVAALLGLAEEDVPEPNIVKVDPNFPVVVGAIVRKPLSSVRKPLSS